MILKRLALGIVTITILSVMFGCKKENPNEKFADTFVGSWSDTIYGSMNNIIITKIGGADINIYNLGNEAVSTKATVKGNTFTIPFQGYGDFDIDGSGAINDNKLIIVYGVRERQYYNRKSYTFKGIR